MNSLNNNNSNMSFKDKLCVRILLRILDQDENAMNMASERVIDYIEDKLSLHNWKAFFYLLNEDLDSLLSCNFDNVNMACKAKVNLLTLLCNSEPNAGDGYSNSGHHDDKVNWGVVPKFKKFEGNENEAYSFI